VDESIARMQDGLGATFVNLARKYSRHSYANKIVIVACSAIATALHFVAGDHWNWATYVGLSIAPVLLLSSISLLFLEFDAPELLSEARAAIDLANKKDEELNAREVQLTSNFDLLTDYKNERRQIDNLYFSMADMRQALEIGLANEELDAETLVVAMVDAASRSLRLACGFELDHHFTLAVYVAETHAVSRNVTLRCIAQDRSVPCVLSQARAWPNGVGIGGSCFASSTEVIVPDITDPGVRSAYRIPVSLQKEGDTKKYRAMAAVPIALSDGLRPWGVVIGTSDQAGHFSVSDDDADPGPQAAEALRAVAGMVALAVRSRNSVPRSA
jgi:hypothetical protein